MNNKWGCCSFYSCAKNKWIFGLQFWVDTFPGWIEAFPCYSEQAKEVIKILIPEIIPRFGLLQSLQSDDSATFNTAITPGVSKALGLDYNLHCSWRPQFSRKVEKTNDVIKRHLHKLTQETQDNWLKIIPIALMRTQAVPKKEGLFPFECIYGTLLMHRHCYRSWSLRINYVTQLSAFKPPHQLTASHSGFLHFKGRTFFNSVNTFTINNNRIWRLFLIWWHLTILRWTGIT